MNIPMKDFTKETRKIRQKNNHKLIHSLEYVQQMTELQKRYFAKIDLLPLETKGMHSIKMKEILNYRQALSDKFIDVDKIEWQEDFHTMHDHSCHIREQITKEITETLKNKYYDL